MKIKFPRNRGFIPSLVTLLAGVAALLAGGCGPGSVKAPAAAPAAASALSDDKPEGQKIDPVWLAKAEADYPLTTCVVSGSDLKSMGEPFEFVYKVDGQPDRLVRFCCPDCVADFKKEPAKFLAMIDAAAAAKKNGAPAATTPATAPAATDAPKTP
jgi:hypothetical protein